MKITSVFASNFLGAHKVAIDCASPVNLICGRNGHGKSSVADAVRLAMTASLSRVALKKDAAALITDGADVATAEVKTSGGEAYSVSITRAGKIVDSHKGHDHDPRLPYVLDGQRLASLSDVERRGFLFGLMGTELDHKAITKRLLDKGLDAKRVQAVAPLLRAGFEPAAAEAKRKATESKGAWKQTTGETYGAVKAETWRAAAVAFDPAALADLLTRLAAADTELAQAQQILGGLTADARRFNDARQKIAGLRSAAEQLQRRRDKLATDEAELATWQATLLSTTAAAGNAPRVGLVHDLARAVHYLLPLASAPISEATAEQENAAEAALVAYKREHGPLNAKAGDPEALARLPAVTNTRNLMASAVRNSMRDLKASEDAAAEIALLTEQTSVPIDAAALAAGNAAVDRAQQVRNVIAIQVDKARLAKAAAESTDRKTVDAKAHHADVSAWDAIGDALAPSGIPAELLEEAMDPINDRLLQSAADTGWAQVVVHGDMRITVGLRPYALLSESEKWRADAMLAESVAFLSGLKLLMLDRMDVLDHDARPELLRWLDTLSTTGELDTALVFATLRALPAGLPDTINSHWIASGNCGVLEQAA